MNVASQVLRRESSLAQSTLAQGAIYIAMLTGHMHRGANARLQLALWPCTSAGIQEVDVNLVHNCVL